MFKCIECGEVFEEPEIYGEHHPYGMGYATEAFACCPYCRSNFEEAIQCEHCGEWFFKYDLENGICEECAENEAK